VVGYAAACVVGDLAGDRGRFPGGGRGVVDDVAEQAHIFVGAAELLAGGRDASLERDGLQQRRGSELPSVCNLASRSLHGLTLGGCG